jgi:16S rRNA processing protein RimM
MTEYFKIGKLVAAVGLQGELLLKHTLGKKTSLKGLQAIFIEERKNSFIPWFIHASKLKGPDEVYLKLEEVDSREAAARLVQKEAWLPEADFKKFAARSSPASLLGYTVIHEGESLGQILEVIEQPHQVVCRLEIRQKEVLVPVNENTLQKIDHRTKQVILSLPEGLLDVYLT